MQGVVNKGKKGSRPDIGFTDVLPASSIRQQAGVVHRNFFPISQHGLVHHGGGCDDEVQVVFPLQPLLHNLHVQQTQEAAPEAESHGAGHLWKNEIRSGTFHFLLSSSQAINVHLQSGVQEQVCLNWMDTCGKGGKDEVVLVSISNVFRQTSNGALCISIAYPRSGGKQV